MVEVENSRSAIGRMTVLLEAFDRDLELTLAQLTARSGLPKSTVHRTVELLVEHGWLLHDHLRYRLGTRLFEMGSRVRETSELQQVAVPYMEDLYEATRQVVNLGVLDGTDVLYVEKIWGHSHVPTPPRAGRRFAASSTALGKAMLAFAPAPVVDHVIAAGLQPRTARTIVDPRLFRDELRRVVAQGYALDDEEFAEGMRCCATAIQVADRAIGAVSVTGRAPDIRLPFLVPRLRAAADGIGRDFQRQTNRRSR